MAHWSTLKRFGKRECVKDISRHGGVFEEETNDPVKDNGALDALAESMHISSQKSFSL